MTFLHSETSSTVKHIFAYGLQLVARSFLVFPILVLGADILFLFILLKADNIVFQLFSTLASLNIITLSETGSVHLNERNIVYTVLYFFLVTQLFISVTALVNKKLSADILRTFGMLNFWILMYSAGFFVFSVALIYINLLHPTEFATVITFLLLGAVTHLVALAPLSFYLMLNRMSSALRRSEYSYTRVEM